MTDLVHDVGPRHEVVCDAHLRDLILSHDDCVKFKRTLKRQELPGLAAGWHAFCTRGGGSPHANHRGALDVVSEARQSNKMD